MTGEMDEMMDALRSTTILGCPGSIVKSNRSQRLHETHGRGYDRSDELLNATHQRAYDRPATATVRTIYRLCSQATDRGCVTVSKVTSAGTRCGKYQRYSRVWSLFCWPSA
jgi:hypothetical protein